jgi:hypothetical protein
MSGRKTGIYLIEIMQESFKRSSSNDEYRSVPFVSISSREGFPKSNPFDRRNVR